MSEESKGGVVQSVYDAISDTTVSIAVGSIEKVLVKRLKEDGSPKVTTFTDKRTGQQKSINNTHRYALLLKSGEDQKWVSFGEGEVKNLKYESQFQIKNEDGGYVSLREGMVIRVPVKEGSYRRKSDGKEVKFVEGKKNLIKITDASGARDPSAAPVSTPKGVAGGSSSPQGKPTKVYGDVVSVDGSQVKVKEEGGREVSVTLTDDQLAKLVEGGRLTGIVAEDGTILSGFKTYGPRAATSSRAGSSGSKRDNSGVEVGHALNGALNLQRSGLTSPPVFEIAKVVHDITKRLKQEVTSSPASKGMSEYDIGAMVGHAVLNASRDIPVGESDSPVEVADRLRDYSNKLLTEVVPLVSAYVKGENLPTAADSKPDPKPEPKVEDNAQQQVQLGGNVDMAPEVMDFDDDIPFASICLMYPNHAIHSL